MRIEAKLITILLSLTIIPLLLVGTLTFTNFEGALEKQILGDEILIIESHAKIMENSIINFRTLVLVIRDFPPIQGLIRSEKTGIDPLDKSKRQQWIERLQDLFSNLIINNQNIDQIRYINEHGIEVVRVNSNKGNVEIVSETELQNKSETDYFQKTMQYPEGKVYASNIGLNKEHEIIETPHKPVLRFATPVFATDGTRKGIVIINIHFNDFFYPFKELFTGSETILIDADGQFIIHPEHHKRFSKDLGTSHNYFTEQPELKENLEGRTYKNHHDQKDGEYRIWRKIQYDQNSHERYLVLFSVTKKEILLKPIAAIKSYVLALIATISIISLLIIITIARSISLPIQKLTKIINDISKGKLDTQIDMKLKRAHDETGELAKAFERVIASVKLAILRRDLKKEELGIGKENLQKPAKKTPSKKKAMKKRAAPKKKQGKKPLKKRKKR